MIICCNLILRVVFNSYMLYPGYDLTIKHSHISVHIFQRKLTNVLSRHAYHSCHNSSNCPITFNSTLTQFTVAKYKRMNCNWAYFLSGKQWIIDNGRATLTAACRINFLDASDQMAGTVMTHLISEADSLLKQTFPVLFIYIQCSILCQNKLKEHGRKKFAAVFIQNDEGLNLRFRVKKVNWVIHLVAK